MSSEALQRHAAADHLGAPLVAEELRRYDDTSRLRPVGRGTPLRKDGARRLAELLTPATPGHPWAPLGGRPLQ
ncbi:hypothetical protein AB0907_30265 [Streptomyces sp. NPDC006975]|uniref:hypothetical protein n=1 Tax=Streptomyces sp. NPDC006975 TaxID=3154310 RepID=UPI003452E019